MYKNIGLISAIRAFFMPDKKHLVIEIGKLKGIVNETKQYSSNRISELHDTIKRLNGEMGHLLKGESRVIEIKKDERLCIYCSQWRFETGEPWCSDITPGSNFNEKCQKKHWKLDPYGDTGSTYRGYLRTAKTCNDFEIDPEIWSK